MYVVPFQKAQEEVTKSHFITHKLEDGYGKQCILSLHGCGNFFKIP